MNGLSWIPHLNASLNAVSLLCLLAGYAAVKTGRERAHKAAMMGASLVSGLFLVFYLYYHAHVGHTVFTGPAPVRTVYLSVLASHILLAGLIPVFVILLVRWGLKDMREKHKKLARWAWPIWIYVSLSGLFVYYTLYHWHPAR